MGDAHNISSI